MKPNFIDEVGALRADVPEGVRVLRTIMRAVSQIGDGVARGFSAVHRDAGPMPPAVDGGVRNIMVTSLLLETACESLADALAKSGYTEWAEASRDPLGCLQAPLNPGKKGQDPAGDVLDALGRVPVRQVPLTELALNQAVKWGQSTPGDDFALLMGQGPANAVDALMVAEGAMAVLEVSIREALGDVRELYPAVARSPYGHALDALDGILTELKGVREDLRGNYAELQEAPGTETWEHVQRVYGMPSGTVGRP